MADIDEDLVMDLIAQGMTQTRIAAKFGVDQGNYNRWLYADKHRLIRARDAMTIAAQSYSDMALDELDAAQDPMELAKAKERAYHFRWLAARYNRALFGDKLEVQQDTTLHITVRRDDLETVEEVIADATKSIANNPSVTLVYAGREGGVLAAGGDGVEGNPTSTATSGLPSSKSDKVSEKPKKKRKSKGSWIHGGGVMLTAEEMGKDTN